MSEWKKKSYFILAILFCQVDISKVATLCKLIDALVLAKGGPDLKQDPTKLHPLLCTAFVFCYLWSVGGNIMDNNWDIFDTFIRQQFEDNPDAKVTTAHLIRFYHFPLSHWAWFQYIDNLSRYKYFHFVDYKLMA